MLKNRALSNRKRYIERDSGKDQQKKVETERVSVHALSNTVEGDIERDSGKEQYKRKR